MSAPDLDRARAALHALDPGCDRDTWHRIGRAAVAAGLTVDEIDAWSSSADNYAGTRDVQSAFRTIRPDGGTGVGTLFHLAKAEGWSPNSPHDRAVDDSGRQQRARQQRPSSSLSAEVWGRCVPATSDHGYIAAKNGVVDGLRVLPLNDPLTIAGQAMGGALVVPSMSLDGLKDQPVTLQFVGAPEQSARWKAAGRAGKLNLPGAPMRGVFVVGELRTGGTAHVVEGIGQAWACWKATGHAAVAAFGWGNVRRVAAELRQRDPSARIVIVPDRGKEADAATIALEVGGLFVSMPDDALPNFDANDYAAEHGHDALQALLDDAQEPIEPEGQTEESRFESDRWQEAAPALASAVRQLDYVLASDLLDEALTFDDELVEGTIGRLTMAVLYGDSNSGKTFAAIDVAASICREVPWLGRRCAGGLVVYLATEAVASVQLRLRAYQRHHGVQVPGFVIVQSPINLFDGQADVTAVLALIEKVESLHERKAVLIVGDTLARIGAGANENSGEDMSLVLKNADAIRSATGATFLWVHHTGKDAARGMRGWSGMRAAIDTEMEVTVDEATGLRSIEITKQRDLPGKGERIGFRLEALNLGVNRWGTPRGSCVVVPSDAPPKSNRSKRPSEVAGAITEFLKTRGCGCLRGSLAKHFDGTYLSTSVYREIRKMLEMGLLIETAGIVALPGKPGVNT